MKKNVAITKIMSDQIVTANLGDHFSDVRNLMEVNKIHHVPVVDGERLVGVVSRTDILKYSHSASLIEEGAQDKSLDQTVPIEELMTSELVTIKVNDTVKHAVEILGSHSFNSLPVIDESSHKLVGIVTTKDIMGYLISQY